jgi:hypothetical protein
MADRTSRDPSGESSDRSGSAVADLGCHGKTIGVVSSCLHRSRLGQCQAGFGHAARSSLWNHERVVQRGLQAARAGVLVLLSLATLAGCGGESCLDGGGGAAGPTVVLERGHLGQQPWQLVAWEQGGLLGLGLDGASQNSQYSGGVGFCAGPAAGFWLEGSGPGHSAFYYGPAPVSAKYAVLTASGYAPVIVPTRPIPQKDGLPSGRFFVADPPGPTSVSWDVMLKDAAGHTVRFTSF